MGGGQTKEEKELNQRLKALKKEGKSGKASSFSAEGIGLVTIKKKHIAALKEFVDLNFSNNKLAELPQEISILDKLSICDIRFVFFFWIRFKFCFVVKMN